MKPQRGGLQPRPRPHVCGSAMRSWWPQVPMRGPAFLGLVVSRSCVDQRCATADGEGVLIEDGG